MKLTIRRGVWETNSSSVHAISITKKNIEKDLNPLAVHFNHGEYGWEHNVYSSVDSKASYLYQALFEVYSAGAFFGKYDNNDNKKNLKLREEAINWIYDTLGKYGVGAVFDTDDYDASGWSNGYIDHGCELIDFVEAIIGNEKRLLRYLFGDGVIVTSNDNSDMDDIAYFRENTPEKDYEIFEKWN